jgi:hypothetical protein
MTSSQGNGPRAITRVRQRRAKTAKLSRSPTNAPGFKRARPPARTALICQIAKRLAAATEQYEQDELIWRLTAALHAPGLPDVDQTTADANWSLVCLTTGVGVPPLIPSRDMHAANDLIETPSVGSTASVRANRVSTLLDDENVCFTGSELFDWAVAIEAPSATPSCASSPRPTEGAQRVDRRVHASGTTNAIGPRKLSVFMKNVQLWSPTGTGAVVFALVKGSVIQATPKNSPVDERWKVNPSGGMMSRLLIWARLIFSIGSAPSTPLIQPNPGVFGATV